MLVKSAREQFNVVIGVLTDIKSGPSKSFLKFNRKILGQTDFRFNGKTFSV